MPRLIYLPPAHVTSSSPTGINFNNLILDGAYAAGQLPDVTQLTMVVWTTRPSNKPEMPLGMGVSSVSGATIQAEVVSAAGVNQSNGSDQGIGQFLGVSNVGEYPLETTWRSFLLNVDFAAAPGNRVRFWHNDTEYTKSTDSKQGTHFDASTYTVIAIGSSVTGTLRPTFNWFGDIAEIWVSLGNLIDFTIEANRRFFVTAGGRAVALPNDGEVNTILPHFYFSVRQGDPLTGFLTNRGIVALTGGALTVTTGSMSPSGTNP